MLEKYLLMRWDNIPLARINGVKKTEILTLLKKNDNIWYGYTKEDWEKALATKEFFEHKCKADNILGAHELAQIRRKKEYINSRACYKLLNGICKALDLK